MPPKTKPGDSKAIVRNQSETESEGEKNGQTQTFISLASNKVLVELTLSNLITGILFFLAVGFSAAAYWIFDIRVEKVKYEMINSIKQQIINDINTTSIQH